MGKDASSGWRAVFVIDISDFFTLLEDGGVGPEMATRLVGLDHFLVALRAIREHQEPGNAEVIGACWPMS